jgi:dTDP-4-amino-4,6-dideoxygalactose transaminase
VRVPRGRDEFSTYLTASGIGNRVYYPGLVPHSTAYRKRGFDGLFPAAEGMTAEVLSLPVHPALGPDEIDTVIDVARAFPGVRS